MNYSVNGADPVTQILLDRGGRNNWEGNNSVSIGENGPVGSPGGLSNTGLFDAAQYVDLSGATPVADARMWNVAGGVVSFGTFARNEVVTAALTIENYVDDVTNGSLSASSGNGESYNAGVWTITGGLGAVNAALAEVTYTFGSAPPPVAISLTADDQDAEGPVNGAVAILAPITGGTVYVDDDFGGALGSAIADADGGPPVAPAMFLVDAFPTLGDALTAIDETSTIVVNDGDYSSEVVSLTGTQTLRCADPAGPVVIGSLNALATNSVELQGNSLTLGNNAGNDGIHCAITGSGGLTKVGTDMLVLRGPNTYTGTTTILEGVLRVGFFNPDGLQGSLDGDGPVVVTAPGQLDLNVDVGRTISQTGAISGTGTVWTLGDGTIIFDGPAANTFSGGLDLGDGAISNFDGTNGNQNGFVVVNRSDHLGTGKIVSRGAQLQAGSPGIVIPNDIDIDAGGFRNGGQSTSRSAGTSTRSTTATVAMETTGWRDWISSSLATSIPMGARPCSRAATVRTTEPGP